MFAFFVFALSAQGPPAPARDDGLQAMIDATPPGGVLVVPDGTYAPIRLDKPLTLIGGPSFRIEPPFPCVCQTPHVRLEGPGSGRVTLVNLRTAGVGDSNVTGQVQPAIDGGGFDELTLIGSRISPLDWGFVTGQAPGAPGIRTDVALVAIADSVVQGGASDSFDCGFTPPAGPAIEAPGSEVVVLDSLVRGGDARFACTFDCDSDVVGYGGDGIRARRAFVSGSLVEGGRGALVEHGFHPSSRACGRTPDGTALVVQEGVDLAQALRAPAPAYLGSELSVELQLDDRQALLAVAVGGVRPSRTQAGWSFVDLEQLVDVLPLEPASGASLPIPVHPALLGTTLILQARGMAGWLGAPLVRAILLDTTVLAMGD